MPCYTTGLPETIIKAIDAVMPNIIKFRGEKKFLVGPNPTYIDFYFFELVNLMIYVNPDLYKQYPAL
jgi:glutathione S-transferase